MKHGSKVQSETVRLRKNSAKSAVQTGRSEPCERVNLVEIVKEKPVRSADMGNFRRGISDGRIFLQAFFVEQRISSNRRETYFFN